MSDAWQEIQAIKSKRNRLRENLEKRKRVRQDILDSSLGTTSTPPLSATVDVSSPADPEKLKCEASDDADSLKSDPRLERELLKTLNEATLQMPISSAELVVSLKTTLNRHASHRIVCNLLQKFATQKLITLKDNSKDGRSTVDVVSHYFKHF